MNQQLSPSEKREEREGGTDTIKRVRREKRPHLRHPQLIAVAEVIGGRVGVAALAVQEVLHVHLHGKGGGREGGREELAGQRMK